MNRQLRPIRGGIAAVLIGYVCAHAWAAQQFPPPEFESDYRQPPMQMPKPRAPWQEAADVAVLAGAMSVAAWLALRKRSRRGMFWLAVFSVVYFGFYREGCICAIGSIQNVALALAKPDYALPLTVVLFFALPLLFALLFLTAP